MPVTTYAPETWTDAFRQSAVRRHRYLDKQEERARVGIRAHRDADDLRACSSLIHSAETLRGVLIDRRALTETLGFLNGIDAFKDRDPRTEVRLWLGSQIVRCGLYDEDHDIRRQRDSYEAILQEIEEEK